MLGGGCGVSQYPQFYGRTKNIYQVLPRPYMGSYSDEKGHPFWQEPWIIALEKYIGTFVMVSISDMQSVKYWQNLGKNWILQKIKFLKNSGLVVHVLHH